MKNKLKRLIATALSSIMCFGFLVACKVEGGNSGDSSNSQKPSHEIGTVVETDKDFVKNGRTNYFILSPDSPTNYEKIAASELSNFLYEATNIRFETVSDSRLSEKTGNYISVGNTQVKADKGYSLAGSSKTAFEIKTVDDNVYIYGAAKKGYGPVFGVYEFLNTMFNYEFYYEDEIYIEKKTTAKFKEINVADDTDMNITFTSLGFQEQNVLSRLRYRYGTYSDVWNAPISAYHNSFSYINPDEYATEYPKAFSSSKNQLCYTGGGDEATYEWMQNTIFNLHKEKIDSNPEAELLRFSISLQDNQSWCSCAACTDIIEKYGGKSATLLLFMNDQLDRLNAYVAQQGLSIDIRLATLAYYAAITAPVLTDRNGNYYLADDAIKGKEGIEILFAPLGANTAVSLKSPENTAFYTNLQKWKLISDKFGFWLYTADFTDYLVPYDWWTGLKENIEMMGESNVFMYFNQDAHSDQYNGTCFQTLKGYLNSKLAWDKTLDMEELTDAFFENYFKVAAKPMRNFYNSMRASLLRKYKELDYQGSYLAAASNKYFTYGEIVTWKKMLNEAYASIEPLKATFPEIYEKLYKRISLEKVTVDYLDVEVFGGQYSAKELLNKKYAFKDMCSLTKITAKKEGVLIDNLYKSWGIA